MRPPTFGASHKPGDIMQATITVNGHGIAFDRRDMGGVCYVWAFACIDGAWVQLGDPWLYDPNKQQIAARLDKLCCAV